MVAPKINLNIDAGLLTLTREDGRERRYRRTEDRFSVDHQPIHVMQDAVAKNMVPTHLLLEAETFPQELLARHDSPNQPFADFRPGVALAVWSSVFKYRMVSRQEREAELRTQLRAAVAVSDREVEEDVQLMLSQEYGEQSPSSYHR